MVGGDSGDGRRWVVVDVVGGGKRNRVRCLFVVCGTKSNIGVCRESTWANSDLLND